MSMSKQQERLGSGKSAPPRDNLDLDVIDAQRMGYGCRYGQFKADHPYTKDANEARLGRKKPSPQQSAAPRVNFYTMTCRGCGQQFTTTCKNRRYCDDNCKKKKENAEARAKHAQKETGGNKQ